MKLLICSEGSPQAERALRLGATIAVGCRAETTLLGISEAPGDIDPLHEALKRGQALLAEQGVNAELITKSGHPIAEILKRTEEAHYDLVVIGAVRKQPRGQFWMSSKSYEIIRRIRPPVLLVSGECLALKHILICTGGKDYIDPAVRLAGEIAKGLGASVTLLHVLPEPPAIYAHLPRMEETAARLLQSKSELGLNLRRGKEILEALGVPVEVRLRSGSVLAHILEEIQAPQVDLVVTGSALSGTLRTYVLGDISREIVNQARCAVLVARSHGRSPNPPFSFKLFFGRREPAP